MKLSHKPRDLRGKLHNPVVRTNTNRPGGRFSERRYREGFFSSLKNKAGDNSTSMFNAAVKLITGARGGGKKVSMLGKGDK